MACSARGHTLAGPLSSGQAPAVIARSAAMAHLVHRAFADGLDLTFMVAAGFALTAAITVLTFVRPARPAPAPAPHHDRPLATARHTP